MDWGYYLYTTIELTKCILTSTNNSMKHTYYETIFYVTDVRMDIQGGQNCTPPAILDPPLDHHEGVYPLCDQSFQWDMF